MSISAIEANRIKQAPETDGVIPAVLNRWSARSFAARTVSGDDLKRIFEAARWAASAYNEQPWRFLLGQSGSPTYQSLLNSLIGFNQAWAASAPVLILGVAKRTFTHNGAPNEWAMYDLGAATAALTLQAAALGLTTHTMAGYDQPSARVSLRIPDDYAMGAVIALGYQGEPAHLANEQLIGMETTPRARKAIDELVYSYWAEPVTLG